MNYRERYFKLMEISNGKEDFSLSPWWVTGITDAKGSFSINFTSKTHVYCVFEVNIRGHSKSILYYLQRYFNCGEIMLVNEKYNIYKFIVTNNEDLYNNILPHFDKYSLVTSKNLDYLDFKKVVLMCKDRFDVFNIHRRKIIFIKNNMNSKRSFEERHHFYKDLDIKNLNLDWVYAFIDLRGLFYYGVYRVFDPDGPDCLSIPLLFIILTKDEIKLADSLQKFIGMSNYKIYNNIKDVNNIEEIKSRKSHFIWCPFYEEKQIVKFSFNNPNHHLLTINYLDYVDWLTLILMYNSDANKSKNLDINKLLLWIKMWQIKNRMFSNNIRTHWHRDNIEHKEKIYEIKYMDFVDKLKKSNEPNIFTLFFFSTLLSNKTSCSILIDNNINNIIG